MSAVPGAAVVPRLPLILSYHKIERRWELGVTRISPRRFARQMERFAERGYRSLSLAGLAACARGEREPGEREFAITFDDAYRGLREYAFPVLAELGFTASCFVITRYAGRLNRWDVAYGGRRFAHLAWRDMRRWQDRGVEFGSHTATHPRLTWLEEREVALELAESRLALQSALGIADPAISYPFGAAGPRERALAAAQGYGTGYLLAGRWDGDRMGVTRHPVYMWAPLLPGAGVLAPVERWGAVGANRCAVGTTIWQRARAARVRAGSGQRVTES